MGREIKVCYNGGKERNGKPSKGGKKQKSGVRRGDTHNDGEV